MPNTSHVCDIATRLLEIVAEAAHPGD